MRVGDDATEQWRILENMMQDGRTQTMQNNENYQVNLKYQGLTSILFRIPIVTS
jgi:hypothetical protein